MVKISHWYKIIASIRLRRYQWNIRVRWECVVPAVSDPPDHTDLESSARPSLRGACCAFTLIELLVVISVIALLIGILLPVLGAARGVARQVACATQQRQVGYGFMTYAIDHQQRLPRGVDTLSGVSLTWDDALQEYLGNSVPAARLSANDGLNLGEGSPILKCPADPASTLTPMGGGPEKAVRTYVMPRGRKALGEVVPEGVGILQIDTGDAYRLDSSDLPDPVGTLLLTEWSVVPSAGFDDRALQGKDPGGLAKGSPVIDTPSRQQLPASANVLHGSAGDFNYTSLFVDGHVELRSSVSTYRVGPAGTGPFLGAWSRSAGD